MNIDVWGTVSGLDYARKIRQSSNETAIAFYAKDNKEVVNTINHQINPIYFIVEESADQKGQINEMLDLFIRKVKQEGRKEIRIQFNNNEKYLPLNQIDYIETSGCPHRLTVFGQEFAYQFYGKIKKILKEHPELRLVHRSVLVNFSNVREVDYRERKIIFESGNHCYFALTKISDVRLAMDTK